MFDVWVRVLRPGGEIGAKQNGGFFCTNSYFMSRLCTKGHCLRPNLVPRHTKGDNILCNHGLHVPRHHDGPAALVPMAQIPRRLEHGAVRRRSREYY